jgi:hypothetical protein
MQHCSVDLNWGRDLYGGMETMVAFSPRSLRLDSNLANLPISRQENLQLNLFSDDLKPDRRELLGKAVD